MQRYAVHWEPGVRIISWRSEDPTAYQEMKYDLLCLIIGRDAGV